MIGRSSYQKQFSSLLFDFIDMGYDLVLLANDIDWGYFTLEFKQYYSNTGQP